MKRILFITAVLLITGTIIYAQQQAQQGGSTIPTSNQTKQNAQQYLDQAKSNNSEFLSMLDDLKARNGSNKDSYTFNRLKSEIERIEATITSEEKSIKASLDRGTKVNTEVMDRIENFINQHSAKLQELEEFVSD